MSIAKQHLDGLNESQQEAVLATEGPVLIFAGAGSGKTKCLTHRLAYIVDAGKAKPDEILAITFTNKAAQELAERIVATLGIDRAKWQKNPALAMRSVLPWVGTFHSICVRILRLEAEAIGLKRTFTIFDNDDKLALIKRILKESNLDPKQYQPQAIAAIISSAKNELLTPDQFAKFVNGHFQEVALEVYRRYQRELFEAASLDFDDLIMLTVKTLEEEPPIREKYQRQFRYAMVDEYQDTNNAQYRLVALLTNPKTENLCVVGDDFQSIYSWRGANFQNILNFQHDYPKARVFKLEQNYRSTQTILKGANSVIEKVRRRSEKVLWTENEQGPPITVYEASNAYAEADFIAGEIRALRSLDYPLNEFAVLYRTNAQSRVLEEIFLAEGIPYRLIGAIRFYERREVKDILAYLRLLLNPEDKHSYSRVVNVPPRGIGPKTLITGGAKLTSFNEMIDGLRSQLASKGPVEATQTLIKAIKYSDYINDGTPEGEARWENVEELLNLASEYQTIEEFLEHVALVSEVDNYDRQSEAVTLMTMHASKGLEFAVVFISGMEEGLCPHLRALEDENELDEERRLCYVAMTRAKKRLYLTLANQRIIHGGLTATIPSRFVKEIDESLIDRV